MFKLNHWLHAEKHVAPDEHAFPKGSRQMAATASSVEKRVLALEINQGVSDQTKELENRIRDLESMVRTARYVVTFCAGLITLVGIGVTAYVSSLTSEYNIANSKIEETKALLLTAQTGAEKTQVEITAQQTAADKLTAQTQQLATETQDNIRQTQGLQNTFDQLVKDASSRVRGAASEAVANAASTVFAPIPAFQQKTNSDITNLNTRQSQLVNLINEEFGKLQNGDSQQMEPLVPAAGTIDCGGGGFIRKIVSIGDGTGRIRFFCGQLPYLKIGPL